MTYSDTIQLSTQGFNDAIDITGQVQDIVNKSKIKNGLVCVFVSGSTAGVTTIEYEPGVIKDLQEAIEKLAPQEKEYQHNERWGDARPHRYLPAMPAAMQQLRAGSEALRAG